MEAAAYRARRLAETPLYALLESLYESVKGAREDLFERRYGLWRGFLDGGVHCPQAPSPLLTTTKPQTLDALDFVARLLAHVPDPRRHLVHDYGACSNVVRGQRKARGQARQAASLAPGPVVHPPPHPLPPSASLSPSLAALRRGWAQLIRRVYEVDPLVCPRCQGVMRVVAFLAEGRVIRHILDHPGGSAPGASLGHGPTPGKPPHVPGRSLRDCAGRP